jgi:hypothetical protein
MPMPSVAHLRAAAKSSESAPCPLPYQAPGHPIAYFPSLAPQVGGTNAAILLCQLLYWTPRAKDPQGWIYKSQLEIVAETGMSRDEQRTARNALKARGLLQERYDRLAHQLYLKVNVDAYNALVAAMAEASDPPEPLKLLKINTLTRSERRAMRANPLKTHQIGNHYMGKSGIAISGNSDSRFREVGNHNFASSEIPEITAEKYARARENLSKKCAYDGCDAPACPHWQLCAYHACCDACASGARQGAQEVPHVPTPGA